MKSMKLQGDLLQRREKFKVRRIMIVMEGQSVDDESSLSVLFFSQWSQMVLTQYVFCVFSRSE